MYGFYSIGKGWWFSSFRLCSKMDPAWCMAIVFISLNVCLRAASKILNFSLRMSMEGACVVPPARVVMTIRGSTFHPYAVMSLSRG